MVAEIAGVEIELRHVQGPMGVRGRNSDNTLLRQVLDWEPRISLEEGLKRTYAWIEDQVRSTVSAAVVASPLLTLAPAPPGVYTQITAPSTF